MSSSLAFRTTTSPRKEKLYIIGQKQGNSTKQIPKSVKRSEIINDFLKNPYKLHKDYLTAFSDLNFMKSFQNTARSLSAMRKPFFRSSVKLNQNRKLNEPLAEIEMLRWNLNNANFFYLTKKNAQFREQKDLWQNKLETCLELKTVTTQQCQRKNSTSKPKRNPQCPIGVSKIQINGIDPLWKISSSQPATPCRFSSPETLSPIIFTRTIQIQ